MKINLLILILPAFLTGCGTTEGLYDAGGAAAGGAVAAELTHGNPIYTAIGAAGGAVVTDAVQKQAGNRVNKAYNAGYSLGKSDAVKQDYWVQQSMQKPAEDSTRTVRYYPVPAPDPQDGTKETPHDVYIPVVE